MQVSEPSNMLLDIIPVVLMLILKFFIGVAIFGILLFLILGIKYLFDTKVKKGDEEDESVSK